MNQKHKGEQEVLMCCGTTCEKPEVLAYIEELKATIVQLQINNSNLQAYNAAELRERSLQVLFVVIDSLTGLANLAPDKKLTVDNMQTYKNQILAIWNNQKEGMN